MPSFFAHFFAVGRAREAIARISMSFDFIIPGRTFSQPMRAVEITPQRTGFFAAAFAMVIASPRESSKVRPAVRGENGKRNVGAVGRNRRKPYSADRRTARRGANRAIRSLIA